MEQDVSTDLNEMDKSAPQPGRDGKVSHSTYGSRDKKGSDYFKGKELPVKPITVKQMEKDALAIQKKQGVAEGSVIKKPQPYNEPDWAKKLPKEKLDALAGPRYKKDKKEQGVAEGLNEFAPPGSGDDGNDGFSEETLKMLAAQWYNGDEDPRVERTLAAAGWEIGQDEGYDDEPGVFVVQAGDVNGNSYISWPADELKQGVAEGKRIARKPGQPANSKKHSDLYTDENPKGTITGLKFATAEDARASVSKIRNSGRSHSHKIQAAVAMEQRAKAAGKTEAASVYRKYINATKKNEGVAEESGISKSAQNKFHTKLDRLVHDTFGKRKSDMEEGAKDSQTSTTVPNLQKPRQGPLKPQTGGGKHRDKKREQKSGIAKHRKSIADALNETSAGAVATVINPGGKPKSQVGSLFGGTYKQTTVKETDFAGEKAKPKQIPGDQVRGNEPAVRKNGKTAFLGRLVGNQ